MRASATPAEHRLWQLLRAKRFAGFKFRRQYPIGRYIADFACPAARLIIEADGGQHGDNPYDVTRDAWLAANGWRVLRLWNDEIFNNEEGVLTAVSVALDCPLPNPSPEVGEGLSRSVYG